MTRTPATVPDGLLQTASTAYETALNTNPPSHKRVLLSQIHNYPRAHLQALRAAVAAVLAVRDPAAQLYDLADELDAEARHTMEGAAYRSIATRLRDRARTIE